LKALEAESIHIIREVVAEFERPVMLYSIGKDSSVLLRLAQKAFYPGPIPFPLLHVDTTYKFREMIAFRDRYAASHRGAAHRRRPTRTRSRTARSRSRWARQRCCGLLKTKALLDALRRAASTPRSAARAATRSESRAKERIFSLRDEKGQWDPKRQRPELWNLLNGRIRPGESIRVFPLSNWTEIDVWHYIDVERHPGRAALLRQGAGGHRPRQLASSCPSSRFVPLAGERLEKVMCRMRSLGCSPAPARSGPRPTRSPKIIEELISDGSRSASSRHRPRSGRVDGAEEARRLFLMPGLLRICTAGSVDDGKSTLIGRLLYDSRGVYEDQIRSVEAASRKPHRRTD
jgi:sulfate adenylyltransferase subunit 2